MREKASARRSINSRPQVQAKPEIPASLSPVIRKATASGGHPLDTHQQHEMAARFGHDFSQVRIHTDRHAAETAGVLGAGAFAVGNDIVFGENRYVPGSTETERLLAHELTHVVQQADHGMGDATRRSRKSDRSEREANDAGEQVVSGRAVHVQAAPDAAVARDEEEGGGWLSSLTSGAKSLASGVGDVASEGWDLTKKGAGAVYDNYEKSTDFNSLKSGNAEMKKEANGSWWGGGLNGGIDALEKTAAEGNQKMVDDAEGHWYSPLAKASAWMSNAETQVTGGVVKGVADLGIGLANGLAHPLDAAAGIEGILEHDSPVPFLGSTLKAGHGLYDLAAHGGGQYGNSMGDLANHIFNPMQQQKDDAEFNTNLVTGIIAPDKTADGKTDWSAWKEKPLEAAARAVTNIAPMVLGAGEALAGDGAAEAGMQGAKGAPVVDPVPAPEVSPMANSVPAPQTAPAISPMADSIPVPQNAPMISPMADSVPVPSAPVTVADPPIPSTVTAPGGPVTVVDPPVPSTVTAPGGPVTVVDPPVPSTVPAPGGPATIIDPPSPNTIPGLGPDAPSPNTIPGVGPDAPAPKTIPGVGPPGPELPIDPGATPTLRSPVMPDAPPPATTPGIGPPGPELPEPRAPLGPDDAPLTQRSPGVPERPIMSDTPAPADPASAPADPASVPSEPANAPSKPASAPADPAPVSDDPASLSDGRGNIGPKTGEYGAPDPNDLSEWDRQAKEWTEQQGDPRVKELIEPSPKTDPSPPPAFDPDLEPVTEPQIKPPDPFEQQAREWADGMPGEDQEYIKKFLFPDKS